MGIDGDTCRESLTRPNFREDLVGMCPGRTGRGKGGRKEEAKGGWFLRDRYCQLINGSATRVASCSLLTGPGLWVNDTLLKACFVDR
jgi:hypothetical protein